MKQELPPGTADVGNSTTQTNPTGPYAQLLLTTPPAPITKYPCLLCASSAFCSPHLPVSEHPQTSPPSPAQNPVSLLGEAAAGRLGRTWVKNSAN